MRTLAAITIITLCIASAALAAQPPLERILRDVSAVLDPAGDERLLLIETEGGVATPRTLRPGELYSEGWVLQGLTATSATLKNGEDVRTVDFSARFTPGASATAEDVIATSEVSLTNAGGRWDRMHPDPVIRARLDRAIAAGDTAALVRLGAEREDFATAGGVIAFGAGKAPWGTTAMVIYEGRPAVIGHSNGRMVIVANPATQAMTLNFAPPEYERIFGSSQNPLVIRGPVPADFQPTVL